MTIRLFTYEERQARPGTTFPVIKRLDISGLCAITRRKNKQIYIGFQEGTLQKELCRVVCFLEVSDGIEMMTIFRFDQAVREADRETLDALKSVARWNEVSLETLQTILAQETPWR